MPSGMSQATTAISATTHNMKFGTLEYSALQCSARCFPAMVYDRQINVYIKIRKEERLL